MSAGYATKLSYREDLGGQLGDPELTEAPGELQAKLNTLRDWVGLQCWLYRRAEHLLISVFSLIVLYCLYRCAKATVLLCSLGLEFRPHAAFQTFEDPLVYGHCREHTSPFQLSKQALELPSPA